MYRCLAVSLNVIYLIAQFDGNVFGSADVRMQITMANYNGSMLSSLTNP